MRENKIVFDEFLFINFEIFNQTFLFIVNITFIVLCSRYLDIWEYF